MKNKVEWKPGNMLYPLPAVLVSSRSGDGRIDVCTVAWAGTVCTNPPMIGISLRPSRQTYAFISETDVFVVNVTTEEMTHAVDYCGVKSGKNENKFETAHLTPVPAAHIDCPMIGESPVSIECRVKEILRGGFSFFGCEADRILSRRIQRDRKSVRDLRVQRAKKEKQKRRFG